MTVCALVRTAYGQVVQRQPPELGHNLIGGTRFIGEHGHDLDAADSAFAIDLLDPHVGSVARWNTEGARCRP